MENQTSSPSSQPVRWAWILSLCTALFWIVLAAVSLIRPALSGTSIKLGEWILALLMFGNAAVFVWLGNGLRKKRKPFYYLTIAYLLFNLVLTITDDFGTVDLIYLVYMGILILVLLFTRKKFMQKDGS